MILIIFPTLGWISVCIYDPLPDLYISKRMFLYLAFNQIKLHGYELSSGVRYCCTVFTCDHLKYEYCIIETDLQTA